MRADMKSRFRAGARVCSGAIMVLLVIAALGPAKWAPRTELGWQFDHFIGYFGITLFICLAWPRPFVVGGVIMAVAALLEALQALTPDRSANLEAALWGAAGALAAAFVCGFLIQAWKWLKSARAEKRMNVSMTSPNQLEFLDDRPITDKPSRRRPASRGFTRFLVAICIGVAGTLAWQAYGEATKQIIATRAPELGWSPEAKQMIARGIQQLGWTKPPAGSEKTAVEPVAPKAPAAPSVDPAQVQQIAQSVAAVRQTVEQLAAGQGQMARDIARLESAVAEILVKIPELPPQPATPSRKPTVSPPSSRAPTALPSSRPPTQPQQ
jgi:VanZ family protein